MPVYDFHCPECETTFEVSRGFAAASNPVHCPADNALCQRIYTMPAVVSRGGAAPVEPSSSPSTTPPSKWNSHGHTHGPGGYNHTH